MKKVKNVHEMLKIMKESKKIKRECIICKTEIKECMGFVLARDIVTDVEKPREFCQNCSWTVDPKTINGDEQVSIG